MRAIARIATHGLSTGGPAAAVLTGLRPSPTRYAVAGWGEGAPVGGVTTVTGCAGPVYETARSG